MKLIKDSKVIKVEVILCVIPLYACGNYENYEIRIRYADF